MLILVTVLVLVLVNKICGAYFSHCLAVFALSGITSQNATQIDLPCDSKCQICCTYMRYILYIHDYLINATGSQKISCLCLLDLSAASDTIDHSILITRLSSWFGIHGSVLNWFKSYLSSRSFRVECDNHMSSPHTCSCGVPQGSVLGPLLFIMYTTP